MLAGALILVTVLAAGPLQPLDVALQGFHAKKYTPNWAVFLDQVPNAVAGQAVCLPVLLVIALVLARRHRTWHPLAIVVATEIGFYVGIGGMKVLLGRTAPAAGAGGFWQGGVFEHGWYGIAYPSGHAAEAVLMYGAAAYLLRVYADPDVRMRRRLRWLVALITINAIVVAFYLGYHWPTDLLGGIIAGGLVLRVIVNLDRAIASGRPILRWRRAPAPTAPVVPLRTPSPTVAPAAARTVSPAPVALSPRDLEPPPRPLHAPAMARHARAHPARRVVRTRELQASGKR